MLPLAGPANNILYRVSGKCIPLLVLHYDPHSGIFRILKFKRHISLTSITECDS